MDTGLKDLVMLGELAVEGSRLKLLSMLLMIDRHDGRFAIVSP